MADILNRIWDYKIDEVAALPPLAELEARASSAPATRDFAAALRSDGISLIAEIKKASPSKGIIRDDFDPVAIADSYARGGAACLSCLTDAPSFQGSDAIFERVRARSPLPMLRKDFMIDPIQIVHSRALGADAILVIMAMVDDGLAAELMATAAAWNMTALVETHSKAELDRAVALGAQVIGINNRDLRTFETSLETFSNLARDLPTDVIKVAESAIRHADDVAFVTQHGADAILVGESLMRQTDVTEATRKLLGCGLN